MCKKILVFLLCSAFLKGHCSDIIIKFFIKKDSTYTKHKVTDYLLNIVPINNDFIDLDSKQTVPAIKTVLKDIPGEEIVVIKYKIKKDGLYLLQDFIGHEIFLDSSMEHDTILLNLAQIYYKQNGLLHINDSIASPWFYKITYPEKYKYMGFFDSLAYKQGDLRFNLRLTFKTMNHELIPYLSAVNKVYLDRINFYNVFNQRYHTPAILQYYAIKEIQYCYYNDLLEPIVEWDPQLIKKYPIAIQDTINNIGNNLNDKELFENTAFYKTVLLSYVSTSGTDTLTERVKLDSNYLINRLVYCKNNLSGGIRNYAIAWFMVKASQINSRKDFYLFYNNYDSNNSTPGVNRFVDSLYIIMNRSGNFSHEELLSLIFEDSAHNKLTFKAVFNKTIIVIDCWATWCAPCRAQTPAFDSLADKYKNQVQFISISADQFISKWDNWLLKIPDRNKNVVQLHANGGFEHVFFRRLFTNAIPRYILISKEGKILNLNMPLPSLTEEFEEQLKKYTRQQ